MATNYFGSTLTDLQTALTNDERMRAQRDMARAGNETALSQQMIQAAVQRDQLRQQSMQQAAQNALAQKQLEQTDYFNRGRLTNEGDRIRAEMELARASGVAAGADRDSRERIAAMAAGARDRTPEIAAQENELALAAANFANILNERDKLQNDLAGLSIVDATRERRGNEWFTRNSTAEREAMPKLSRYFAGDPNAAGMDYNTALTGAKAKLEAQLQNLSAVIAAGQQSPASQLVSRSADGKWVSTFKPSVRTANPYFGPPTTQSTTNGVAPFFNAPTATNAPVANPEADVNRIVEDFRAGRIDRATAEQALRSLGLK